MAWAKTMQDEMRNIKVLGYGATYVKGLTVIFRNGTNIPDGVVEFVLEIRWHCWIDNAES